MLLKRLENRANRGYTTFGSMWARGEALDGGFYLKNASGNEIPVQTRVTAWWPDGSVKWAAHTADSELMGDRAEIVPLIGSNAEFPSYAAEENGNRQMAGGNAYGIRIEMKDGWYEVDTGAISLRIPMCGDEMGPAACLAENIRLRGQLIADRTYPVLVLEQRRQVLCDAERKEDQEIREERVTIPYRGEIDSVILEETGPLQSVFCLKGSHSECGGAGRKMPFSIRIYLWAGSPEMRFVHTYFYDGSEDEDYLKGMGIRFEAALTGAPFDRHIKFGTDSSSFHEAAVLLNCNHPRLDASCLEGQMAGRTGEHISAPGSLVREAVENLPIWNRYTICQDSPSHFAIRKRTKPGCCELSCMHGRRAPGTAAVCGENGGFLIGLRDFWQKYPSGIEVDGLKEERTKCTVWFYSPEAEAYDFRHYSDKSYMLSCYEGFENVGASAYGIAVTSECLLRLTEKVPQDAELKCFSECIQKPSVYTGTPEYYHEKKAFGNWSLVQNGSEVEIWMEEQLSKAFEFYRQEVENRNWFGLFDYGDFMHTYDGIRHCWRYDMGGFAWQNTELVPTYWLWLHFLRTGKEEVYMLAEAMSRHCSEVDIYHFGPMKGIGSRHNVRHWGCSCKEPRVSMAGHHRFFYYLTGDYRMGEVLADVKDADQSLVNLWNFREEAEYGKLDAPVFVRSGPDWSSFVSNWMTQYERTLDPIYRKKIENGVADLKKMPFGLASGPGFEYDMEKSRLIYKGESENNGNMHLQICMGGPEIWAEAADMLEDEEFKDMLADHGRFYYLSAEEKAKETGGKIVRRPFAFPYFAAALAAYSAERRKDKKLAKKVVQELLHALASEHDMEGFEPITYAVTDDGRELKEIPWIKTNFAAQWCLNAVVVPDLIRDCFPKTMEEMRELLSGLAPENYHHA